MADTTGIIFMEGTLVADPSGDAIEFGELQEISFEFRDTKVSARGPNSLYPLVTRIQSRESTLRASFLKVKGDALYYLLGGTLTYDAGPPAETTLTLEKEDEATSFGATLKTPTDGSDLQVVLYKITPMNFTLPGTMRDFSIPNFEAEIQVLEDGSANDGKIMDIIFPGDQTIAP